MFLFLCYSQDLPDVSAKFTAPPILMLLPSPSLALLRRNQTLSCCHGLSTAMTKAYQHVCNKPSFSLSPQYKTTHFCLVSTIKKFWTEVTTALLRNTQSPPKWKERVIVPWGRWLKVWWQCNVSFDHYVKQTKSTTPILLQTRTLTVLPNTCTTFSTDRCPNAV